eukprot:5120670-Pyramimonas_sp.AAC.1
MFSHLGADPGHVAGGQNGGHGHHAVLQRDHHLVDAAQDERVLGLLVRQNGELHVRPLVAHLNE